MAERGGSRVHERWARLRFSIIGALLAAPPAKGALRSALEELAARDDLPEFDIIALHGIWSWISDENRAVIVELARRKLAVGGMLYISYNCTPGWSPVLPLRHLLTLHAELAGSDGKGIAGRIDSALGFAQTAPDWQQPLAQQPERDARIGVREALEEAQQQHQKRELQGRDPDQ